MYIKVSSVCSENPTHSCSRCAGKPPRLLFLVLSESCVRFGLKHFRPKSLDRRFFGLTRSSSSSSCWTGLWKKKKKKRGVQLQSTLSLGLSAVKSLCCMAQQLSHVPISCILLWAERHLFAVLKLVTCSCHYWVPLSRVASTHVGTVCWPRVTRRQISLSIWCYLHVLRAGNEHQPVNVDKTWLVFLSAILSE